MPDDPEVSDEQEAPNGDDDDSPAEERIPRRHAPPGRQSGLDAFAGIQRQLAAVDFPSMRIAQRAIEQSAIHRLPEVWAAQDLVAKHFAQSIDFSQITGAYRAISEGAAASGAAAAQQQWADALANSVHLPALENALASSAAFAAFTENNATLLKSIQDQRDLFAHLTKGINLRPTLDLTRWLEALDRCIPANLRSVENLDRVATLALDDGLPLSWVPRAEIVNDLLEAKSPEERHAILDQRRDEILDDCESALLKLANEWAEQCRAAIAAMRLALDGPAQSHASNIIDSVVLALHGKNGRNNAKARAQEEFDDLPLQLAAENLTLRPLFRAFTTWFPSSGVTPPEHFARHPTAHAVGHAGVFAPRSALIAVMLATSLTVQYSPTEKLGRDDT